MIAQALKNICSGDVKIDLPSKKWKGYCFVYVYNKADLNTLIAAKQISLGGYVLSIKPHKKGQKLNEMKQDLDERRVFVRIISRAYINFEPWEYFEKFGQVESCYMVDTTVKCQKGLSSAICYVLFREKEPACQLLKQKKLNHGEFQLIVKKVYQKEQERNLTAQNRDQDLEEPELAEKKIAILQDKYFNNSRFGKISSSGFGTLDPDPRCLCPYSSEVERSDLSPRHIIRYSINC